MGIQIFNLVEVRLKDKCLDTVLSTEHTEWGKQIRLTALMIPNFCSVQERTRKPQE